MFVAGATAALAACGLNYRTALSSPVFAFDDDLDPNAAGWGEESDPTLGGVFAEEF
jgi:hypothetical protein